MPPPWSIANSMIYFFHSFAWARSPGVPQGLPSGTQSQDRFCMLLGCWLPSHCVWTFAVMTQSNVGLTAGWRLRVGQHSDTRLRQCSLRLYWAKKPVSLKNTPVGAVNIINSIKFQSFNTCLFKYSLWWNRKYA